MPILGVVVAIFGAITFVASLFDRQRRWIDEDWFYGFIGGPVLVFVGLLLFMYKK